MKKLDPNLNEVFGGASKSLVVRILGLIVGIGLSITLGRTIGSVGVGVYNFFLNLLNISSTVSRYGLDKVAIRDTARKVKNKAYDDLLAAYIRYVTFIGLFSFLITAVLLLAFPYLNQCLFRNELFEKYYWVLAVIIPYSIIVFNAETLNGFKKVATSGFFLNFSINFFSLTLCTISLLTIQILTLENFLLYFVISVILVFLMSQVVIIGTIQHKTGGIIRLRTLVDHWKKFRVKEILSEGYPFFSTSIWKVSFSYVDILVLGVFASSSELGLYAVALRLTSLSKILLIAINSISSPKFAELTQDKNDLPNLRAFVKKITNILGTISIPGLLLYVFLGEYMLQLFGNEFKASYDLLVVLAIGQFVNVTTGSVGALLLMSGHQNDSRWVNSRFGIFNLCANITLAYFFGAIGVAIATALTTASKNLCLMYFVYKRFGFITWPFVK